MITVGSLFSGIGGFELGFEMAGGFEIKWQVENDPYAIRVLERHWPDVRRWPDVRTFPPDAESEGLEGAGLSGRLADLRVDLICGGFPCQPVSCAGRRAGGADARWLWPEFARVVRILRPRWVLAENVSGLLSVDDGRLFGEVLRDLAALGYGVEWDCIPAAAVGAPHIRDRVWILAHADYQSVFRPPIARAERNPWAVEPDVGRVAHGVPARVDRLRCLGNAVVPQVVKMIAEKIPR